MSASVRRALVVGLVCVTLLSGMASAPAAASPAGQAVSLTRLQAYWQRTPAQKRTAICAVYRRSPSRTLVRLTNRAWARPVNRRNMTIVEWLAVYKTFFRQAC